MAKYISHASLGSNGKATSDVAGDNNQREVCIANWYNKPWNVVIRINNEKVRKQFGNNMIDIAKNNNVGYDQNGRNTLLKEAEKVKFDFSKIATKCECDCSSMVTVAILGAIYTILGETAYKQAYAILVIGGNCATTRTLRSRMQKLTMISVSVYTSSDYIASTSKAMFGDIYNKEGSHVVAYIDDGNKANVNNEPTTNITQTKPSASLTTESGVVAGKTVVLNNTKGYNSESASTHYGTKTGTFYLWDNVVKNGRIRITNAKSRVGVKGQVTCWVNISDIGLATTTTSTPINNKIVSGKVVTLNNTKCYNSESVSTHYGVKTGTFYLWDNVVKNSRIRITNAKSRVGVKGQVTCWINVADVD